MRQLHAILTLILVLAAMPWGAYAGAAQAREREMAVLRASLIAAQTALVAERDDDTALTRAPRHCRTGTLPGAPCSHLIGPPEAQALPPAPAGFDRLPLSPGRPREGRVAGGILDPPRSC